jgi:hypothetical protein
VLVKPTLAVIPDRVRSAGGQIADIAAMGGVRLDEAQAAAAEAMGGVGLDRKWAAFEVVLYGPRQSVGKTELLIARALWGLFVARERSLVYSAHEVKTATRVFKRVKRVIDRNPQLGARIGRVSNRIGSETLELVSGQTLECMARSTSSGRGFTGSTLLLDEAHTVDADEMAAQLPMLATVPNPQIVYALSFADERSLHVARVRERALAGEPGVCWVGWEMGLDDDVTDRRVWAKCNPGIPDRVSWDYLEREFAALGPERFARERLGRSEWPTGAPGEWLIVSKDDWEACAVPGALLEEPGPNRSHGSDLPSPPFDPFEKWGPSGVPGWVRHGVITATGVAR